MWKFLDCRGQGRERGLGVEDIQCCTPLTLCRRYVIVQRLSVMPENMLGSEILNPVLRHGDGHGFSADTLQGDEQRWMPRVERMDISPSAPSFLTPPLPGLDLSSPVHSRGE